MKPAPELPLTHECHHYKSMVEVPWDIQKYWAQRYSLFSYYDDGIQLTDDAWFGVTPEPVATKIAEHMATAKYATKTTVIDLFAGAGGNAIAFALSERWEHIIAIEKDASTLACAQHNADVYGVRDAITWVLGDSFEYLARLRGDGKSEVGADLAVDAVSTVLFASPPWGGVSYRDHDVFDLQTMEPYNLATLHGACRSMDHVLYLPRTSDLRQIAELAPNGEKVEVVQYCMEGASKAMVAYIPGHSQG